MLNRLRHLYLRNRQLLLSIADAAVKSEYIRRRDEYENALGKRSGKVFSQSDEDGIVAEILRRIGIERGTYCEFGLGDGLECNTLALAAQGWRGFWVSGQAIGFSPTNIDPQFFRFDQSWVDMDNVVALFRRNADAMGLKQVDLLSFDLDSRDLFFLSALLNDGLRPAVVVAEYNAKFRPPIRWSVAPDDSTPWQNSDYMGASLASLASLFGEHGYRLVACNPATGANAFFVRNDFAEAFRDVPSEIDKLFIEPYFDFMRHGHPADPRTALRALAIGQAIFQGNARPEFIPGGE